MRGNIIAYEGIHCFCFSPDIIRMKRYLECIKCYVLKLEGKKLPGRHRCRWDDDIKLNLKEIRSEDVEGICLVQCSIHWGADVNTLMNL